MPLTTNWFDDKYGLTLQIADCGLQIEKPVVQNSVSLMFLKICNLKSEIIRGGGNLWQF
jgi:hypothetical protein